MCDARHVLRMAQHGIRTILVPLFFCKPYASLALFVSHLPRLQDGFNLRVGSDTRSPLFVGHFQPISAPVGSLGWAQLLLALR